METYICDVICDDGEVIEVTVHVDHAATVVSAAFAEAIELGYRPASIEWINRVYLETSNVQH